MVLPHQIRRPKYVIRFPELHATQKIFWDWHERHPNAQVLVAPCGTKTGKSFGAAAWLLMCALVNPRSYCVWIGPSLFKCKVGYRYMKAMCPDLPDFEFIDGKIEIRLANGSFIVFLHGKDSERLVEGEAVDFFVIDEAGKQSQQLWHSLFTTITHTLGLGIVTGTPRGFSWYYDIFRKAKLGDPFFCWTQLKTESSPFITKRALAQAKRLLPDALYQQYFEAVFISMSTTFGDIMQMFDQSLIVKPTAKFWIHPDPAMRSLDTCTGWDIAKKRDWSVFYTVNTLGKTVGYARMRRVTYGMQVDRLAHYMTKFFTGDRMLRFDNTGVGDAVGELILEADIDASITPVIFSNKSKQEMVSRSTVAIESGWFQAPRIEQIEHEFGSYEVNVTRSGLFTYSAPSGEHDDVVSAAMLAISGAYQSAMAEDAEKVLEKMLNGDMDEDDDEDDSLEDYADAATEDADAFFNEDEAEEVVELEEEFAFE